MRVSGFILVLGLAISTVVSAQDVPFVRGDANGDGNQDISDPVYALSHLFSSGPANCLDALDVNDDGQLDIADPVFGLGFLFVAGSPVPPAPFPNCGADPTADTLGCAGPVAGCPAALPCFVTADCPPGFYCEKPVGACGEEGVCSPIPDACPAVFDPVCGCDGDTYSNACEAAMNGVSVAYEGECIPGLCFTNADCGPGEFCLKDPGDCSGPGVCTPIPFICSLIFAPVCGCDGLTYSNECVAWSAGVSVMDPSAACP